jgi:hypothetical protein
MFQRILEEHNIEKSKNLFEKMDNFIQAIYHK